MRAHLSVFRASACGIPASKPLSVLDRDKAYFLLRCVHRVPCTSSANSTPPNYIKHCDLGIYSLQASERIPGTNFS